MEPAETKSMTVGFTPDEISRFASEYNCVQTLSVVNAALYAQKERTPNTGKLDLPVGRQIILDLARTMQQSHEADILESWSDEYWANELLSFSNSITEFGFNVDIGFRDVRKISGFPRKAATAGMFLRGFPTQNIDPLIHFKVLFRIWIFIQNIQRTEKHGFVCDSNILNLAHFFNHHDDSVIIRTLANQIVPNTSNYRHSFEHFTLSLRLAAYRCPEQKPGTRGYKFLESLKAVCKGEFKKEVSYQPKEDWLNPSPIPIKNPTPNIEGNGHDFDAVYDLDGDITSDILTTPSEQDTYEEQYRSANSVIRSTAEKLSFLQYGWFKPTHYESDKLQNWLSNGLNSDCKVKALGCALTAIAISTSESLATVQYIPIGKPHTLDWHINDAFTILSQSTPRHRGAWKPKSKDEKNWVLPSTECFRLKVNPAITKILQSVLQNTPTPIQLGALWYSTNHKSLESWFREEMQALGLRLLSGMLPEILPHEIYNVTGQNVLSQLLCAHSQTALTGASAYISGTEGEIHEILSDTSTSHSTEFLIEDPSHYAVGSRLVLVEDLIRSEIKQAKQHLEELRFGNPIDFHNAYVSYCVMTLLAATGARPVTDPFESLNDFNFEEQLVVIEDKSDNTLHGPRIIPLTRTSIELIHEHYLKHLKALADSLDEGGLSTQIHDLLNSPNKSELPLFFFIKHDGNTAHVSLSSPEVKQLFSWPLKPNLFRHYFIQKLLNYGVDNEVVEAWSGHVELNLQTYGIHSERCWHSDAIAFKSNIQNLIYFLGFEPIAGFTSPPDIEFQIEAFEENTPFGRNARQLKRQERIGIALDEVDLQFEIFSSSLTDEEPTQDQVDQLINEVIFTGKPNRPYRNHLSLRFERVVKHLRDLVESKNITPFRYKKVARSFSCPPNIFSLKTPNSLTLVAQLDSLFDGIVKNNKNAPSQISSPKAAQLTAVAMCLRQKIAYFRLVKDIGSQKNCRLLKFKKRYYLEYSEKLERGDFQMPVQRHELHPVVTRYLNKALKSPNANSGITIWEPLIPMVKLLCGTQKVTFEHFLERLCKTVDLTNSVKLPGIVVGALNGTIPPTSLHIQDWVRALTRQSIDLTEFSLHESSNNIESQSDYNPFEPLFLSDSEKLASTLMDDERQQMQDSALEYIKGLRAILRAYVPSNRQDTISKIRKHNQLSSAQTSSMMIALGEWISNKIVLGHNNKERPLRKKTVRDYFSTLSSRFGGLVYNIDLHELDGEDITDIYASMLDDISLKPNTLEGARKLLINFQTFIEQHYHAPKPNWSELGAPELGRNVSPGWLGEEDYLLSLKLVERTHLFDDPKTTDFASLIMILCKRYGLRRDEALYIRRKDIIEVDGQYMIYMEAHRRRGLKSTSSRRIIPPIDPLTELELQIVSKVLHHYDVCIPNRSNLPLVHIVQPSLQRRAIRNIPRLIISTIREVTGTSHLVLHHLRHSYHTKAAGHVLPISTDLSRRITGKQPSNVRQALLGSVKRETRRSSMALARIMGHATPNTGQRSYNHLVTEWIDQCVGPFPITKRTFDQAIDLDEAPKKPIKISLRQKIKLPSYQQVRINNILELMQYVGAGLPPTKACQILRLDSNIADIFVPFYHKAAEMLWFKISRSESVSGRDNPQLIFSRLKSDTWIRLKSINTPTPPLENNHYPEMERLQFLIGQSRQILLKTEADFALMRYVLDCYGIGSDDYELLSRDDPANYFKIATNNRFDPSQLKTIERSKIDNLRKPNDQYERRYCALQLTPTSECRIQTKSELAVAFLAIGFSIATGTLQKEQKLN